MFEHRDTDGQAQVCSKGPQGSSVIRPCQPSFHWIKFWHVRNLLPQSIRLRLSVLVRYFPFFFLSVGLGRNPDFQSHRTPEIKEPGA